MTIVACPFGGRAMRRLLVASVLAFGIGACAQDKAMETAEPVAQASLYDRLGGQAAITAVVDDFIVNVAADPRINQRFAGADIPRLKMLLVEQICQATGGPCVYTGRDMRTAHMGMHITEGEFNALVEDLVVALDKYNVPSAEKTELLNALAGMKGDIVGV